MSSTSPRSSSARRFYWACVCGAPQHYGMRPGPQYVSFFGAEYGRLLHARRCTAWSVVVESPHSVPSRS